MERSIGNNKQAQKQKINNYTSSALTSSTNKQLNSSSSNIIIPNINQLPKSELDVPQKVAFPTLWDWLKAKAIQKAKKYTITVILLPNIIQSLVKSATQHYYGHEIEFVLVGLLVSFLNFMLVSYFLYRWFVTGQGNMRDVTKQKLAQISKIGDQIQSYFVPGNQGNLLKLYCLIVFAGILSKILPQAIFTGGVGLVADLYKQIRNYFTTKHSSKIEALKHKSYQKLLSILASLPKYLQYVKTKQL